MLSLYKQWYQLLVCFKGLFSQGTTYLYPSFQGYIRFVFLLFRLIRPRKAVHIIMYMSMGVSNKNNVVVYKANFISNYMLIVILLPLIYFSQFNHVATIFKAMDSYVITNFNNIKINIK